MEELISSSCGLLVWLQQLPNMNIEIAENNARMFFLFVIMVLF
jgi:hypothetical protein